MNIAKFVLLLLSLLALSCGYSEDKTNSGDKQNVQTTETLPVDSILLVFDGQDGRSVFSITQDKHNIAYIESALGNFVHAIDSIEISHEYGWMYSVNDSLGTIASDKYITRTGDKIKWHYRKF